MPEPELSHGKPVYHELKLLIVLCCELADCQVHFFSSGQMLAVCPCL